MMKTPHDTSHAHHPAQALGVPKGRRPPRAVGSGWAHGWLTLLSDLLRQRRAVEKTLDFKPGALDTSLSSTRELRQRGPSL